MPVVGRLALVLAREFARLAEGRDEATLLTLAGQADFLGLSESHLSRLKRERVPLTMTAAASMAGKLAAEDAVRRAELEQELFSIAGSSADGSESRRRDIVSKVQGLFDSLESGTLVCIEYRDPPRAEKDGQYPELAWSAAEATARGVGLALFQPFGNEVLSRPPEADAELADYLNTLHRRVRRVYRHMFSFAADLAPDEKKKAELASKLVLYERKRAIAMTSGIQNRVFHVIGEQNKHRVFQWVVGADREHFIEWSTEVTNSRALVRQFEPVITYWRDKGILPADDGALAAAMCNFDLQEGGGSASREPMWCVYSPTGVAEQPR
ncbi:MAG: hypothetical protein M3Q69_05715 [Acidobacteriota bacterium]|nr:hypothetical protein [Acidobacteriota bacterium]